MPGIHARDISKAIMNAARVNAESEDSVFDESEVKDQMDAF